MASEVIYPLFKLTFLSLCSLFVFHISGKRPLTVTLLLCRP
jgi:hypothetical protein